MNSILTSIVLVAISRTCLAHNSSSGPITGRYIVGGMPALKNEIPYQVAIYVKGRMECGGSILDEWFIVTAAHCIFPGIEYSAYSVYAGEHSLISHTDDGTEQTRAVHNIFVHEEYNKGRGTLTNDIAIIQLKARLELNKEVARISLPTAGHVPGGMVQTSGWGRLTQGGSTPNVLYKVSLPIIEDAECEGWYNANTYKMDGQIMICAGYPNGMKDSCQGDSGGPLVAYDKGEYLLGIVSWGEGCAKPRRPGVYAEVVKYLDWINAIITY